jgi:NADPH-dependent glutamate synthase beta subunit-like oxidoreductase
VSGLKLARTTSTNGKLQVLAGTEFVEPFDMVIKAIGEQKQIAVLKELFPKLQLDKGGLVAHDADSGQTNLPHVFTAGDCANGGREVVNAVAEGKKAARAMHAWFGGQKVTGAIQPSRYGVKGAPMGSGFDRPIRVPELEEAYAKQNKK